MKREAQEKLLAIFFIMVLIAVVVPVIFLVSLGTAGRIQLLQSILEKRKLY